MIYWN